MKRGQVGNGSQLLQCPLGDENRAPEAPAPVDNTNSDGIGQRLMAPQGKRAKGLPDLFNGIVEIDLVVGEDPLIFEKGGLKRGGAGIDAQDSHGQTFLRKKNAS